MNIFLNSNHDLRAGWKFATYAAMFSLLLFGMGVLLSRTNLPNDNLSLIILNEFALLVPAVAALLLTVRFVDRRPLSTFGVGFPERWQKQLLFGLGIAAGMLAILVLGCFAFGYVKMGWSAGTSTARGLLLTLAVLVLAAASEELIFRGFPLQVLSEGMGTWPAVIFMSLLFGVMHMNNPNASRLGVANTVLAGILLSLAYIKTRSLWMPYGIHVGWNVGLGFVLGFPLSGVDLASLWTTGIAGSDAILGGDYGPEGGLLATFIFAASAATVNRGNWK